MFPKVHIVVLKDPQGIHLRANAEPGVLQSAVQNELNTYDDGVCEVMSVQLMPPIVTIDPIDKSILDHGRWMVAITFK